jgi:hypothetical protein
LAEIIEDVVESKIEQEGEDVKAQGDLAPTADDIAQAAQSLTETTDEPEEKSEEAKEEIAEGEPAPDGKPESSVIHKLRKITREKEKALREKERELREAREKLNVLSKPAEPILGEKPTLEKCDYDSERFERELDEYKERKRKIDEKEASEKAAQEAEAKRWQDKVTAYATRKAELAIPDYEEAEAVVYDLLDKTQQGILVHGSRDSAILVYALGKNEAEAKRIADIKDPIEFAFAVADFQTRLEGKMKGSSKKPATAPEEVVRGTGSTAGTVNATLERLRAEAEKSGDYSKVMAYKRAHREKERR